MKLRWLRARGFLERNTERLSCYKRVRFSGRECMKQTMAISQEAVEHVAYLARIKLEPKELEKLSKQLQDILGFIDKLKKADIKNINPTSHILPINNVLREDIPVGSLPSDKALMNAPQSQGNFFVVPKVIE